MKQRPFPFFTALLALTLVGFHGFYWLHRQAKPPEAFRTFFAEWGYLIRYWCGQKPSLVLVGHGDGKVHFFHLGDVPFQDPHSAEATARLLATTIGPVLSRLSEQGVRAIPVVIPTKMSVYRRYLPAATAAEDARRVHEVLAESLPGKMLDLYPEYLAYAAKHPETPLYPPLDYHWSSTGSALAVTAIARRLGQPEPRWESFGTRAFGPSYLSDQFPIPHWYLESRAEFQGQETLVRLQGEASPDGGRLVIAGTSFSTSDEPESFGGQLHSLGRPIVRFTRANNGYGGGFEMMKTAGFRFRRGDVLVWELPLCCLNLAPHPLEVEFESSFGREVSSVKR